MEDANRPEGAAAQTKIDSRFKSKTPRIDQKADYGLFNSASAHHISSQKIAPHWGDMLRLAGSLKLGRVPATGIMRMLQVSDRPTRLAQAIAEYGRSDKTLHINRLA